VLVEARCDTSSNSSYDGGGVMGLESSGPLISESLDLELLLGDPDNGPYKEPAKVLDCWLHPDGTYFLPCLVVV
jgi:hypothetical protein